MSRNNLILIILGVALVGVIGIGSYLYFFTNTFTGAGNGGGGISVRNFLPFGNTSGGNNTGNENTPTLNKPVNQEKRPETKLLKLVQNPVAGFVSNTIGSTTAVHYVEKETGHIFDIDMSIPLARTRISNTTVPRVHEALFGQNNLSVILRYLDKGNSIQTYSATIFVATSSDISSGGTALRGSFLSEGVNNVSMSPSGTKIFTLVNFGNSSVGTISDLEGKNKSQIFDSPFTDWLPSWTNERVILITTKPSSSVIGFSYVLNVGSGDFKKIYGGTAGLTALLSPDGKMLLVSEIDSGLPSLKIFRVDKRDLIDTGLKSIVDKCYWANNTLFYCAVPDNISNAPGGYPDAWYQGIVSFSDSIWSVDTDTLNTELVSSISAFSREDIDAVSLSQSKDGDYLFFINKKDGSLWSLKL